MNRIYYRDGSSKQNEQEELLIFGYSCKIFRDDEKAMHIDQEQHLVPWIGDHNIKLDRFDVRGALYDLSEFDKKNSSYDYEMTEAEQLEERLCDEERYFSLTRNEFENQIAQEEEMKRLQVDLSTMENGYQQVAFDYNTPSDVNQQDPLPEAPVQASTYNSADDVPFVPPKTLPIPEGMEIPSTVKHNKIILRTAKFVAAQGIQMEILIKAKQASNPFFNFLSFDNSLNPYYKHLISLLKSGKYVDDSIKTANTKQETDSYSFPHLSIGKPDVAPGTQVRSSKHCSYSKLISEIKEKQKASGLETEIYSPSAPSSPAPGETSTQLNVGTVQRKRGTPLIPGSATSCRGGLVDYPSFGATAEDGSDCEDSNVSPNPPKSFSSVRVDYRKVKWPSRSLQMVIDKMACYSVKNGPAFQDLVKSRNDSRFQFMKKTDEYHPYFLCKVQLYSEVYADSKCNKDLRKFGLGSSKNGSGGRSIKFSIKSKETEAAVTSHTTFPIESSTSEEDEDMDEEQKERRRLEREERRFERRQKEEKERKEREALLKKEKSKKDNFDDDSSGNEDLYDIFKYAQEMEREQKMSNKKHSSQNKQQERKKKAAAFLSKLKNGSENNKVAVFGPQLPQDYDMSSPLSSTNSTKYDERLKSWSPNGDSRITLSPVAESSRGGSKTPNVDAESKYSRGSESPLSSQTSRKLLSYVDGLEDDSNVPFDEKKSSSKSALESRSRSRHKRSRARSISRSPDRRDRKRHKRSSYSSHKRYRSRSRSRTSRTHRSHHKKSKHSSHKSRSKKVKKHRKRSPSISSVSSISSRSVASEASDSDGDVQVINTIESHSASRSSSIVSLPREKLISAVPSSGHASSSESQKSNNDNLLPKIRSSLLPTDDNTSSSIEINDTERPSAFKPSGSAAVAKITEMGIQGLYTYISNYAKETLQWTELKDVTVVIDGSNLAYWLHAFSDERIPCVFGGEYQIYAQKIARFFKCLLCCHIHPIVIMDGGHGTAGRKMHSVLSRVRDLTRNCAAITPEEDGVTFPMMLRQVFADIVQSLGICCIQCDYEADQEIIVIAKKLDAYVLSNDTDFFLADVKFVVLKTLNTDGLLQEKKSKSPAGIPCYRFDRDRFCEMSGIKKQLLPFIAVCLGNDSHEIETMIHFHKILPKPKSCKGTARHKLIGRVIYWLKNQKQDVKTIGAKILNHISSKDKHVINGIKMCISSYVPTKSHICHLIDTSENVFSSMQVVDAITAISKLDFSVKDYMPELLNNYDRNSKQEVCSIAYGEKLPHWFVKAYRSFYLNSIVTELLHQKSVFSVPVVESTGRPSVHLASQDIVRNIRALMWKSVIAAKLGTQQIPNNELVLSTKDTPHLKTLSNSKNLMIAHKCKHYYDAGNGYQENESGFDTFEDNISEEQKLAKVMKSEEVPSTRFYHRKGSTLKFLILRSELLSKYNYLPTLYEVDKLSLEVKRSIFFQALNYKVELPNGLPLVIETIIVYMCHWYGENRDNIKTEYVCSLIMNVIMYCILTGRYGLLKVCSFNRSEEKDGKEENLETDEHLNLKTVEQIIKEISREDCRLALSYLAPYQKLKSVKYVTSKNFERDIVHFANSFQSSIYYLSTLNVCLAFPFRPVSIHNFWSGIFHYNMTLCFSVVKNPIAVVESLLPKNPKVVHLFKRIYDVINEQLAYSKLVAIETKTTKADIDCATEAIKNIHTISFSQSKREKCKIENSTPVNTLVCDLPVDVSGNSEDSDAELSLLENKFALLAAQGC